MKDLIIEGTQDTPEINFNAKTGILLIKGRANAGGMSVFYKTMEAWLVEYLKNPNENTTVDLRLEYMNSVFNKLLYIFLDKCKGIINMKKGLIIKWYHYKEDEDAIDECLRFSKIIDFPIELIEFE